MDLIIIIISIIVFIVNLMIITFNKNVDMIITTIAVITCPIIFIIFIKFYISR